MTLGVQHLSGGYGANQVLFDVNLSVEEGEVVCLMGRNGMGKTTTVHSVLGSLPKKSGRVTFQGADITGLAADQIASAPPRSGEPAASSAKAERSASTSARNCCGAR